MTIVFFVIAETSIGQNYQTVSSGRTTYFTDNYYDNVSCIRVDSIQFDGDSILYPFAVIQDSVDYCYSSTYASWIGSKVVVRSNGDNLFFNKYLDTLLIKTQADSSDSWVAFEIPDSITVQAIVTNHDTMSFIGLSDSVKTISFQAYDKSMDSLDIPVNGMMVQLSKNYGLIKTLNYYLFPNIGTGVFQYGLEHMGEFDLVGMSNPEIGFKNLTWLEVNDFQAGDELHITEEVFCGGESTVKEIILRYLTRTNYLDSIVYTYSREENEVISGTWNNETNYSFDTLNLLVVSGSDFDQLPGYPVTDGWKYYNYYMKSNSDSIKTDESEDFWWYYNVSCLEAGHLDGCPAERAYIRSLGGPYYSCDLGNCSGGTTKKRELVYYKKGSETWGNPLTITDISSEFYHNNISVFPVPVNDVLKVHFDGIVQKTLHFQLLDSFGRTVISTSSIDSPIDVSNLNSGVYICQILVGERALKTIKIIIR